MNDEAWGSALEGNFEDPLVKVEVFGAIGPGNYIVGASGVPAALLRVGERRPSPVVLINDRRQSQIAFRNAVAGRDGLLHFGQQGITRREL